MARITVEDCLDRVDNRFQLVLIAARRARDLALGKEALVPWENDKPTVVALRELAEGKLDTLIREKYSRSNTPEPVFAKAPDPVPAADLAPSAPHDDRLEPD